jgi:hypothetical protein
MFQNLRENDTIYVIDKSGVPSLKIGQVVSVGKPMPAAPVQTPGLMMGLNQQFQISIRAKIDGQEGDFNQLLTTESVHDYGNMVVTDSREAALSEIESIKQYSQSIIDSVPQHEDTVLACDEIAKSLNPNYAKEKERDEAIGKLNSRMDNIEGSLGKILKLLNDK